MHKPPPYRPGSLPDARDLLDLMLFAVFVALVMAGIDFLFSLF